jgi:Bacteriophage HK97-gp10, putative tail-component
MADNVAVHVEGLKEFRAALRDADRVLGIELRKALNEAGDIIVRDVQPDLPRRTGRLAVSLKAQSTQREGRVVLGSARVPYAGWIEFGGRIVQHSRQRIIEREFIPRGRWLFPSAERNRGRIINVMDGKVDELARRAGLT